MPLRDVLVQLVLAIESSRAVLTSMLSGVSVTPLVIIPIAGRGKHSVATWDIAFERSVVRVHPHVLPQIPLLVEPLVALEIGIRANPGANKTIVGS
jgi:hypothetical protein